MLLIHEVQGRIPKYIPDINTVFKLFVQMTILTCFTSNEMTKKIQQIVNKNQINACQ